MTLWHGSACVLLKSSASLIRHPGGPAWKDGAADRGSGGPEGARNARGSQLQHGSGLVGGHAEGPPLRAGPGWPRGYYQGISASLISGRSQTMQVWLWSCQVSMWRIV